MINEGLNNNLKALRQMLEPTKNKEYTNFLDEFIDKEITEDNYMKIASQFKWGGMYNSMFYHFQNAKTKETININELVTIICSQLFQIKENFENNREFTKNSNNDLYQIKLYNMDFTSFDNSKEIKEYAIKLSRCYQSIKEYSKKQISQALVSSLLKIDDFTKEFSEFSRGQIIKNLNSPHIIIISNSHGILEYKNHSFPNKKYFSIEFENLFNNFSNFKFID